MEIQIRWYGPFVFVPQAGFEGKYVFDQRECDFSGIYLWTIEYKDKGGYLVNYAGCNAQNGKLRERMKANRWYSYAGGDGYVTIPSQFRQGLSRENDRVTFTEREFLADYGWLSSMIHTNFVSYRVFVAPAMKADGGDDDNERLVDGLPKYVETGIIRALDSAEKAGTIPKFLANKCRPQLPGYQADRPHSVSLKTPYRFYGLEGLIPLMQP